MPQLVKGGKYVFGWSRVGPEGQVRVPPEAVGQYGLHRDQPVILASASRTSGGFVVMRPEQIEASPLGVVLREHPGLAGASGEGTLLTRNRRTYAWVVLRSGSLVLPAVDDRHYAYGVRAGDLLLVVRGSYVGPSFLSQGPLIEEARRHVELVTFGQP